MIERIKSTVRHTFIYSLSNIAAKAVGVLLVPLYIAKLSLGNFGVWDLLDVSVAILAEVFIFGQATSIILLNNAEEYKEKKAPSLFTLTAFVTICSAALVIIAEGVVALFPAYFDSSDIRGEYIRLIGYIVLLRVLNNLFLSKVRADEQSGYFTSVSFARIILITGITIYTVAVLDMGITGVLYSNALGEFLIIIVLLIKMIPQMELRFDGEILRTALKFGMPLVLSSVGFMALNLSDRYIIKYLIGSEAVGLYGLGYRVAGILNMFLILPFNLGLMPIAYKYYGQKDDVRFYSKLMTYSTFFFVWGFVFLSLFSREIIYVFAGKEDYYSAYLVVPIILLAYVLSGMRLTASLGMLLTKNTKHIGTVTLASAALNIILNFIFIPVYGIAAAAVNTAVAFAVFYIAIQTLSDKYFKIPFENRKLATMLLIGSVISGTVYFLPAINLIADILIKFILVILFPFLLRITGFYEQAELELLTSPARLKEFATGILKGTKESTENPDIVE